MNMFSRFFLIAALGIWSLPAAAAPNWSDVDRALGQPGQEQAGGVHRYSFPRSDLKVQLDGVRIKPALALGSWAAFLPMGDQAMVMGDLVLTHEEVNPVLSRLLAGGLSITALHNHLLRSSPGTMYMHVAGRGDAVTLAKALRTALAVTKTPATAAASPRSPTAPLGFDGVAVEREMKAAGKRNGGVLQFSFARGEQVNEQGMEIPAAMGLGTAINFQGKAGGKAAITGDFVLTAKEVDPVLRALRGGGVEVTALHNHMLDDQPRLFFMHFWAHADAISLARTLRAALNRMNVR